MRYRRNLYTSEVHLMGYNSVADIIGLSSCLAVVASEIREITRNSDKI